MKTPYYAVIFTSVRTEENNGYNETAKRMLKLAEKMPGYLGVESARNEVGITVSYWESLEAITAWRQHPEHATAIEQGKKDWYQAFTTRICTVERESGMGG